MRKNTEDEGESTKIKKCILIKTNRIRCNIQYILKYNQINILLLE